MKILIIYMLLIFSSSIYAQWEDPIHGITIEAPPKPFKRNPMTAIKSVNANWIAIVPYCFSPKGSNSLKFDKGFWWGEGIEGVTEQIRLAKENGLYVMVKPQVWLSHTWIGGLDFDEKADFEQWWQSYQSFIFTFMDVAEKYDVEMFCIGTEMKILAKKYPSHFKKFISKCRERFSGKLTYAANWDEYKDITFWSELDYIGVDAYFPLLNKENPNVEELENAWLPIVNQLKFISNVYQKPILFTEYGYLSVPATTYNTWELEKKIDSLPMDENSQAVAFEALFKTFQKQDFWHGGFIWKWTPSLDQKKPKRYTPQFKKAETIIEKFYKI